MQITGGAKIHQIKEFRNKEILWNTLIWSPSRTNEFPCKSDAMDCIISLNAFLLMFVFIKIIFPKV